MGNDKGIHTVSLPELRRPVLIAGFDGWGNALNVSRGMVDYLVRQLGADRFAFIDPDMYYRYDASRPVVDIDNGELTDLQFPGGDLFAARIEAGETDLVLLKTDEPQLRWNHFAAELFSLCDTLGVKIVITLGSMYDSVLHSDRMLSGVADDESAHRRLRELNILPIAYSGPSAVHSVLHAEAQKRGFKSISLWCHCPFYLQGVTHYGMLSHLGRILSTLADFELDLEELDAKWQALSDQIEKLVEESPEIQSRIGAIRKSKLKGSLATMKTTADSDRKVIQLQDFLDPS